MASSQPSEEEEPLAPAISTQQLQKTSSDQDQREDEDNIGHDLTEEAHATNNNQTAVDTAHHPAEKKMKTTDDDTAQETEESDDDETQNLIDGDKEDKNGATHDIEIIVAKDIDHDHDEEEIDNVSNASSRGSKKNNGYVVVNMHDDAHHDAHHDHESENEQQDEREHEQKDDTETESNLKPAQNEQKRDDTETDKIPSTASSADVPPPIDTTTNVASMANDSPSTQTPVQPTSSTPTEPEPTTATATASVNYLTVHHSVTANAKNSKAQILCTWVPRDTSGSELTVIAGDVVSVVHAEPILLRDNPLAADTTAQFDKSIILKSMHWTKIQQRAGKTGVVPSNILQYDDNPVNEVWIRVRIQHSYMAKSSDQLTISAGERLLIYGCINDDGLIKAKRKEYVIRLFFFPPHFGVDCMQYIIFVCTCLYIFHTHSGSEGLIPYNFVEIPSMFPSNPGLTNMAPVSTSLSNRNSSYLRNSISRSGSNDFNFSDNEVVRTSVSRSSNGGVPSSEVVQPRKASKQHQKTGSRALNFVIDDPTMTPIDDTMTSNSHSIQDANSTATKHARSNSKAKLTSRLRAIQSSVSTAFDKMQMNAYSHGISKSLEPIPVSSNLSTPSGAVKSYESDIGGALSADIIPSSYNKTKSNSVFNASSTATSGFQWNAPLQWNRVYVIKDFNATEQEIERVYQAFILDKEARGRHESILSYEDSTEYTSSTNIYNAAAPSRSKKTTKDVMKVTVSDNIEVCGDSSTPEGWILARFCNDKEHKGFVPVSYLQFLDDVNATNTPPRMSNVGMLLQQNGINQDVLDPEIHEEDGSMLHEQHRNAPTIDAKNILRASQSSTYPVTNRGEDNMSNNEDDENMQYNPELATRSKQPLPFHWPFSSYPIKKRTRKGKIIESLILLVLLIIFALPIFIEDAVPEEAPENYNIWFINLFGAFLPWFLIFVLRMLELWTNVFSIDVNPNTRLYVTLLFYIIIIAYFLGLFAIVIEVLTHWEWIRTHSPILFLATMVEMIVFISCVAIIIFAILFILIWTYCCRISRNRWETRIEFYCCTKGDTAVSTLRYTRNHRK